jgi:hypothetical protein
MAESSYLQETKDEDIYVTFIQPEKNALIPSYEFNLLNMGIVKDNMAESGVIIIKKIFTLGIIESFKKSLQPIKQLYVADKKGVVHREYHCITFEEGRQDIWDLSDKINVDIPIMTDIMNELMGCVWVRSSLGALPLKSKNWGRWHRDVIPLFKDIQSTLCLPDFYYVVFIPLNNITMNNGATQIIINSHNGNSELINSYAICDMGDVIIMNGKCLHRSTPNITEDCRDMLYIIYCAMWYNESKF